MLKSARSEESERPEVPRLEGKLLEPWVDVMASTCGEVGPHLNRVKLDLSAPAFVDTDGGTVEEPES